MKHLHYLPAYLVPILTFIAYGDSTQERTVPDALKK